MKYQYVILILKNFGCKIYKYKDLYKNLDINISNSKDNKHDLVSINDLKKNVIIKKKFTKKNFFIFNYKKLIKKQSFSKFVEVKKFRLYNKNLTLISVLNDVVVRHHGLVFSGKKVLKESVENSWYDNEFLQNEKLDKFKINRVINFKCILLSSGTNNLAHFLFESLTKLYYLENIKKIKVIINDKISNHIIEILLAYGFKKNQILIKPVSETWKIKELIFPSLSYFEISQDESNFLSSNIKKNKISNIDFNGKIYISRRDATDSRNLINEIEIENYLKTQGYNIVLLSKLNLQKKIEIFSRAKIIITPLGAGIQNLYFCKKINAKIVLIGTNRYFHQKYFLQLSFFKKIKPHFIQSIELTSYSRDYGYLHSSFYLDLKILKSALKVL